ncbi:NodT family efflux transporter outer membrane factor (OMF) lipoprotein [Sphingomonas leidyi]|uniref:NodT family efflux transporter outer membrane factor (OMF) lipoprotein n=1 Tax=Sphingomonas leidyi TaxID=68569 RepID=A0A7X5ZV06_9SPHN|nr:efflux transporter outer membrane subunit [Sphingomonas leidyi]NIJ64229.1 NodT family efflux transporter outer membrane factor (OMF) lipoprotein [Sphingomonas leidyi]
MKTKSTLTMLVASLLAGCAAVPHLEPQLAPVQADTLGLGDQVASIDASWWSGFGDPQLNRLEEMGLAGNPSLDTALARLRSAEALIRVRRADQLPQIGADASVVHERLSEKSLIPPPYGGTDQTISAVQGALSWDLDLFGRQRSVVRQAAANADAARLDAAAARLAISTSIAQTYVGLARAERLITVADGFIATRQNALRYVRSRIKSGLSSEFELRQAETLAAQAEQANIRARKQRDLLVHALAALVGRGADFYPSIAAPTLALDSPPAVPAVLPADLLGRRPDLLAGQARIAAAVQGRAVARADFLPNVNLQALVGLSALGFGNLFSAGALQGGGGVAIHVPIFEGCKLKAQYARATADLDTAVSSYNETVIGAVRESADAATNVRSADEDLAAQGRVVAGLRETVRLDQVRIRTGLGSQLDAIDSGFRLLEAEQDLVNLQAASLTSRIQLVAALGGGFDPARPLGAAAASASLTNSPNQPLKGMQP